MTTFDEREKGYEKKFAFDADLKFRAESRRNKTVAEWAGAKLGLTGEALETYIKDVREPTSPRRATTMSSAKCRADLTAKGIKVDDLEIRTVMAEALAKAVIEIEVGERLKRRLV